MMRKYAKGQGMFLPRIGLVVVAALAVWLVGYKPVPPDETTQSRERSRTPSGMIYIPGGYCIIGSNDPETEDEAPLAREVFVTSFYMNRNEVTNAEYKRFRPSHHFFPGEESHPATDVTYDDAAAYAKWTGKRLPTENEWEKAARGTDGRRYPWGNKWDARLVASRPPIQHPHKPPCQYSHRRPVGSIPAGASPYGCLDMAGNAWEWVQGFYKGNRMHRILRGGAIGYGERSCRTYLPSLEGADCT